ncbi:MAG: DUF1028 domain-containing protein [Acidimicrobiales bacterium]
MLRNRRRRATASLVAVGIVLLVLASPAAATWSIVATDADTGQVGVAIASCVPGEALGDPDTPLFPVVLVPGTAAAVTQAQLDVEAPARIGELIRAGESPADVIAAVTELGVDPLAALRQHAVVDVDGRAAASTGAEASPEALDAQGGGVSAQGNLLASRAVVEDALAHYTDARRGGADLGTALVAALAAGSDAGGDRRCGDRTALFAQVMVADPGDDPAAPTILLTVFSGEDGDENPVDVLSQAWADGERGVIDLRVRERTAAPILRIAVLVLAVVAAVVAVIVFRRGLGSPAARRS